MTTERHLTWHSFQKAFVSTGAPTRHPIVGEPAVELFTDSGGVRIGLRAALPGPVSLPGTELASVHVAQVAIGGDRYLQIETAESYLHQSFFHLLLEIADAIQLQHLPPVVALETSLAAWKQLLRDNGQLSPEAQVGLFGELWVLSRLLRHHGARAIDAWTGPWRAPHDFRLTAADLEVKATNAQRRRHAIHGLLQLETASDRPLFVVSMSVEHGGLGGQALADMVAAARALLGADAAAVQRLQEGLNRSGYFESTTPMYTERLSIRGHAWLVPVDDSLPRFTREALRREWPDGFNRIGDVTYDLDLEGLGAPDGSISFLSVLP
jgi:ribosomal protein S9